MVLVCVALMIEGVMHVRDFGWATMLLAILALIFTFVH